MVNSRRGELEFLDVPEDRYGEWFDNVYRVFGFPPVSSDPTLIRFYRSTYPHDKLIAISDERGYIGTGAAIDLDLMLPGGTAIPMAGVGGVTVHPTATRRGLQRAMMTELHRRAADLEFPIVGLPTTEWPIYERYGYGPAIWIDTLTIDVPGAGWRDDVRTADIRPRRISGSEARELGAAIFLAHACRTPGEVIPPLPYWDRFLADPVYSRLDEMLNLTSRGSGLRECVALADEGLASYRVRPATTPAATPNGTLEVTDFLAPSPDAAATLWQHLFSIDLVKQIRVVRARADEALRWWVADARHIRADRHDALWLRPLDVPRLLEARQWVGSGSLTLLIRDAEGYADGTYTIEIDNGCAECRSTRSTADLEMSVATLGAILLGGTSATSLAAGGRIRAADLRKAQLWDALAKPARTPFLSYPF